MKIALISFEYPPDTGVGGIGTYFFQIANLFHKRGHYIEVFSASFRKDGSVDEGSGFLVHRIMTDDKYSFKNLVVHKFSQRHQQVNFDLFESPEYMADGLRVKLAFSDLPMVVKLHTPDFLVKELNSLNPTIPSLWKRLRFTAGACRRFRKPQPYWWQYDYRSDPEFKLTQVADLLTTPSVSLGKIVQKKWKIPASRIIRIPYPYFATEDLLNIPITTNTGVITYTGRLEVRKGVAIFSKVVPLVVSKVPSAKFRFIGKDLPSHITGLSMKEFLQKELVYYRSNLEFIDHCSSEKIVEYLSQTDVCVFPSIWENFPNVCLEAMSAGRAIVASKNGGMADMLSRPKAGILVNPLSDKAIANSIVKLLLNKNLRHKLGTRARQVVQEKYNFEVIGTMTEKYYQEIIKGSTNEMNASA